MSSENQTDEKDISGDKEKDAETQKLHCEKTTNEGDQVSEKSDKSSNSSSYGAKEKKLSFDHGSFRTSDSLKFSCHAARLSYSSDILLDESPSFPSLQSATLDDRKKSYSEELNYFLKNLAQDQEVRNVIINKSRNKYGPYSKCYGILEFEQYFKEAEKGIYCTQFSKDGKMLVIGFGSGSIFVLNTTNHRLCNIIFEGKESGLPVAAIRFNPTFRTKFYAASVSGTVTLCSSHFQHKKEIIKEKNNEINAMDINLSGKYLTTVGKDAAVRVYDTDTATLISTYKAQRYASLDSHFHGKRLYAVRYSPESENLFITGGADSQVKLWDIRTKSCASTIRGPFIFGQCLDMKKDKIMTCPWTPKLSAQLWDLRSMDIEFSSICEPVNIPKLKEGYFVVSAQFYALDPNADLILSSAMSLKSIEILSFKQNVALHSFIQKYIVVGMHAHENKLAWGGMGRILRIADFYLNETQQAEIRSTRSRQKEEKLKQVEKLKEEEEQDSKLNTLSEEEIMKVDA